MQNYAYVCKQTNRSVTVTDSLTHNPHFESTALVLSPLSSF